ncbi:MAG: hypothetical protein L6R40_002557 [Gallowayella cf. fulva]|nr:MAG: hypothetical protein L6R40_002557 [Xanthomendoza cf. fulva]
MPGPFEKDGSYEFFAASFHKLNGFYDLLEQRARDLHHQFHNCKDTDKVALSQSMETFKLLADKPKKWIYRLDTTRKTILGSKT